MTALIEPILNLVPPVTNEPTSTNTTLTMNKAYVQAGYTRSVEPIVNIEPPKNIQI